MYVLAIDPGTARSHYVVYETLKAWVHSGEKPKQWPLISFGSFDNGDMCAFVANEFAHVCVIEMIASYGMAVGEEVFETCVWIGRFMEARKRNLQPRTERMVRGKVKDALCHSRKATDANIRQALIDRFGGKEKAIGKKKTPGPLYGVSGDVWAALALAVAFAEEPPF